MNGLAVGVLAVVYALGPTEVPSGRTVTCLSGSGWKCDGEAVSVPHTWNAVDACDGPGATVALPGYGNGKSAQGKDYLRKRAVYSRTLPPIRSGKRYFVKCEGVSGASPNFKTSFTR